MTKITDKFEKQHVANIAKYGNQIDAIYKQATQEASAIAVLIPNYDPSVMFKFEDYPMTQERVRNLLRSLYSSTEMVIVNGINSEWTLANNKNDELSRRVIGDNIGKLSQEQYRRYFSNNDKAREAFLARKEKGLNLSDKVWQYTNMFRNDIEMGLDVGLRNGLSADEMSRDLRQYLQHPDMLFRRVRDEHGNLVLSQRAKAYHSGQGVYRSSYMNARRLAVTETNIAYRTSDYERMQQLDFVVGVEIRLSNNHNCKGFPQGSFYDICDTLAGKYPKTFKFTGWHPHCRCHMVTVLKTEEELMMENQAILRGEEPSEVSVNSVTAMPSQFTQWLEDNAERIKHAKSIPYFMRDNGTMKGGKYELKKELAKEPIETPTPTVIRDENMLREGLNDLYDAQAAGYLPVEDVKLREISDDIALGENETAQTKIELLQKAVERHKARTIDDIRRIQDMADERIYGKAYVENVHALEKALQMKRGKRMTHEQANTGRVNPNYGKTGYDINCSTCSATYIVRRMGFDVSAKPNVSNSLVRDLSFGFETWDKWNNPSKAFKSVYAWAKKRGFTNVTPKRYKAFVEEHTKEAGIYEFNVGWFGGCGGHSTLLERTKDGVLRRIEQQVTNASESVDMLLLRLTPRPSDVRGIMRVDNALFNAKYAKIFARRS